MQRSIIALLVLLQFLATTNLSAQKFGRGGFKLPTIHLPTSKKPALPTNEYKEMYAPGPTKQPSDRKSTAANRPPKQSPKDAKQDPPGYTTHGQPTDEFGNKLSPSGKPQVNIVRVNTKKKAKDMARETGKGAPVKHPSPKKGGSHYHPATKQGEKKPNSPHFEYKKKPQTRKSKPQKASS